MEKTGKNRVKDILEKQKSVAFSPNGVSMWPFIKNHKNTVVIKKVEREIEIYDVIFYELENGREVLHRVIGKQGEDFIVCGDGLFNTELVKKDSVFGIMDCYYKRKKFIGARNPKYLKRVSKYYANAKKRRRRIKCYKFRLKVKNKLKLIFNTRKDKNV